MNLTCKSAIYVPQRYVMTFLGVLLTIIGSTMKYAVSIAITDMVVSPSNSGNSNSTTGHLDSCPYPGSYNKNSTTSQSGEFAWSATTQGLIVGAVYWTYTTLQIPFGLLVERSGYRLVLIGGVLVCSLSFLLTPPAVQTMGAWGFVASRVVNGIGLASVYPSLNVMLSKWAPPSEKSKLGGIIYAGENLGFIFSMATSGLILGSSDNSWPMLFYVYGILGLLWVVLWAFLGYDDPSSHPFISAHEKQYLETSMRQNNSEKMAKLPPTPWRAMVRSLPLWGTIVAQIGHDWSLITIVNELPNYMKTVLHYEIQANGLLTAIPYVAMTVVAVLSGWLSDWVLERKLLSITTTRKIFTSVAAIGPAVGVVGAMNSGCDSSLVVIMFTTGMALMGFYYPSLSVNTLDLSPNYSGTLMGLIAYGGLGGILSPYLTGILAPQSTMMQWRTVFWVAVAILIMTNTFYLVVGSGEVQPWNQPEEIREPEKPRKPAYQHRFSEGIFGRENRPRCESCSGHV